MEAGAMLASLFSTPMKPTSIQQHYAEDHQQLDAVFH
jgi:hypothetical protein